MFPNLARRPDDVDSYADVDGQVRLELETAQLKVDGLESLRGQLGSCEVPTIYLGTACLWTFKRAWRYWVARGPGIPPDLAEQFHRSWGHVVRVDGHCDCPSPREWFRGFAVDHYHIDSQEGLNAFTALLHSIYIP